MKQLRKIMPPGEEAARLRTWRAVAAAFAEREPVESPSRRPWIAVAVAAAAAAALALASPPGRAVIDRVREVVGVERAQPALFSLPAPGRLLVASDAGLWVVHQDGSKRLLGQYREGSWSPFGRFVVATRANELAALEPDGDVRWTLARRGTRFARWGGSVIDTRIAYVDRTGVRVVAGDGTGDRLVAVGATGPLAWRPGRRHELAHVSGSGLIVVATETGRVVWSARRDGAAPVLRLEWSADGRRLLVLTRWLLRIYDTRGRMHSQLLRPGRSLVDASFTPGSRAVTALERPGEVAHVSTGGRTIFTWAGDLRDLAWSPDGRRLLVGSPEADQWIFVSPRTRSIVAVSNVSAQFRSRSFPRVEGWCCPE